MSENLQSSSPPRGHPSNFSFFVRRAGNRETAYLPTQGANLAILLISVNVLKSTEHAGRNFAAHPLPQRWYWGTLAIFLFSIGASENESCQRIFNLLHRLGGTLAIFRFSVRRAGNRETAQLPTLGASWRSSRSRPKPKDHAGRNFAATLPYHTTSN